MTPLVLLAFLPLLQIFPQDIRYVSQLKYVMNDLDSLDSPGLFRSAAHRAKPVKSDPAEKLSASILPVEIFASFNSGFPFGYNDGSLWQGRGFSGIANAGTVINWSWGQLRVNPEWWFAQNQAFQMASSGGNTIYQDYGGSLDRLQSYGQGLYTNLNTGESELRLNFAGFTLGFGTMTRKFGPAEDQNLLMSGNSAGFPMFDIGTAGPLQTALGAFDFRYLVGQTRTSQWYNADGHIDYRLYTGGLIGYSPPFLPGMTFGYQRMFHSPWDTIDAWKVFQFFDDELFKNLRNTGMPGNEDDVDQVLSLTWEWRIPSTHSRLYIEWGRNDHAGNLLDLLMQPDHSQGYVAGIQQKIPIDETRAVLIAAEISSVANTIGTTIRPTGSWYRHSDTYGGYTNDGQLMGAAMGPGSSIQELNLYYLGQGFFLGAGAQRWLFDEDYFYQVRTANMASISYNLLVTGNLRAGISLGKNELGMAAMYTWNFNRDFVDNNGIANLHFELSISVPLD
jgi:hypothetical protein